MHVGGIRLVLNHYCRRARAQPISNSSDAMFRVPIRSSTSVIVPTKNLNAQLGGRLGRVQHS
jgi:hypothetical protein